MDKLDRLEKTLMKLLLARNTLEGLKKVCDDSTNPLRYSIMTRYSILELAGFIKLQKPLIDQVPENKKKFVLCLAPLIKDLLIKKEEIKKIRDGWVAHIQTEDDFKEDIDDLIDRKKFPNDVNEVIVLVLCTIAYVDGLKSVLNEFDDANEKYEKYTNSRLLPGIISISNIKDKVNLKIDHTKKLLKLEKFPGV